jgi:hypothetical protein
LNGRIIRQLHHVVETALTPPDVQDVQLAGMAARNRLETPDALELALERPIILEGRAIDDLHCAQLAQNIARQPHFPITAAADAPEQFMVGNGRGSAFVLLALLVVAGHSIWHATQPNMGRSSVN